MQYFRTKNTKVVTPFLFILLVVFLNSCNKQVERTLVPEYGGSGTDYKTGKVLLIVVDGAAGKAVQQAVNSGKAPMIKSLSDNSMFTYEGLADSKVALDQMTNTRGWANLMTGTTENGVGKDYDDIKELKTKSFLSLLKVSKSQLSTSLLSSNTDFVNVFGKEVDQVEKLQDDQAVMNKVVAELADTDQLPSDVIVAHFQEVNEIGKKNGFYNQEYMPLPVIIDGIKDVDMKIGEILNALKSRPLYDKENWMVIITSNYGGQYGDTKNSGSTYYTDVERNTFTMLYSPRIQSKLLQHPAMDQLKYNFYSPWYTGNGGTESAIVKDPTLFNMGSRKTDTKSYTIQFMIYDTWQSAGNGHTILSKRPRLNNGPGWNIRMISGGGNVAISAEGSSGWAGDDWYQVRKNNPWRVYTYVYKECGAVDSVISYRDGVEFRRDRIWEDEMGNNAPLTIGKIEGSDKGTEGHFYVNNVQFYDIALPAAYLAANYCKTQLDKQSGFEYWDHLIGYWPNDREEDFGNKILPDYSKYGSVYGGANAGRSDMLLVSPSWESGSKLDPNICPLPDASFYRAVFNTTDIPYQIFLWLGADIDKRWKWDGIGWPLTYKVLGN